MTDLMPVECLSGEPGGMADVMGNTDERTMGDDATTCDALCLALVALRVRVAWHAGVISAETAMHALDRACQVPVSRPSRGA